MPLKKFHSGNVQQNVDDVVVLAFSSLRSDPIQRHKWRRLWEMHTYNAPTTPQATRGRRQRSIEIDLGVRTWAFSPGRPDGPQPQAQPHKVAHLPRHEAGLHQRTSEPGARPWSLDRALGRSPATGAGSAASPFFSFIYLFLLNK
jgi:hypothetical protein